MKTSKAHFELFQKYFLEYTQAFGLNNWEFFFEQRTLERSFAQITMNTAETVATVSLSTHWDFLHKLNDEELRRSALHEACHVLIAELSFLAVLRFVESETIDRAAESLTTRLTHLLWQD